MAEPARVRAPPTRPPASVASEDVPGWRETADRLMHLRLAIHELEDDILRLGVSATPDTAGYQMLLEKCAVGGLLLLKASADPTPTPGVVAERSCAMGKTPAPGRRSELCERELCSEATGSVVFPLVRMLAEARRGGDIRLPPPRAERSLDELACRDGRVADLQREMEARTRSYPVLKLKTDEELDRLIDQDTPRRTEWAPLDTIKFPHTGDDNCGCRQLPLVVTRYDSIPLPFFHWQQDADGLPLLTAFATASPNLVIPVRVTANKVAIIWSRCNGDKCRAHRVFVNNPQTEQTERTEPA